MLKENVLEYGTSSVWNDNCEYDSMIDKDCRCDFEGKGARLVMAEVCDVEYYVSHHR